VLIAATVISLSAVGIAAIAAGGVFAHRGQPHSTTATSVSEPVVPNGPSATEVTDDRDEISGVLDTYQEAYSAHDLQRLAGIFTPGISRRGLAAGGCAVSHGQSAVLNDYASQFDEGSGSYELVGLSPGQITVDSQTRAHLHAKYAISPGGTGFVDFAFADLSGAWKISQIYASCA
jgi:hypothetical protein